jgi:hypothetical protein
VVQANESWKKKKAASLPNATDPKRVVPMKPLKESPNANAYLPPRQQIIKEYGGFWSLRVSGFE